ncbi:hypothetical protein B0T18DRAFT_417848 [Schizothecium vesticola]|uniref:Uncharacterized protein n=1 Tax=Schizothecium vesticola TaxID=314040 RepID=A0AA40JZC8_9PEZI|nr:hypothetical protein B0T18DRAFT_417848 [Schizothecium vesticola]
MEISPDEGGSTFFDADNDSSRNHVLPTIQTNNESESPQNHLQRAFSVTPTSTPTPGSPYLLQTAYRCEAPSCYLNTTFKRSADLERHNSQMHMPEEKDLSASATIISAPDTKTPSTGKTTSETISGTTTRRTCRAEAASTTAAGGVLGPDTPCSVGGGGVAAASGGLIAKPTASSALTVGRGVSLSGSHIGKRQWEGATTRTTGLIRVRLPTYHRVSNARKIPLSILFRPCAKQSGRDDYSALG